MANMVFTVLVFGVLPAAFAVIMVFLATYFSNGTRKPCDKCLYFQCSGVYSDTDKKKVNHD